jgi:molybdenum cofactor cytidylyltransferase
MQGDNKLLLPLFGRPIVARVVEAVLEAGLQRVLVVTGHEPGRVRQLLAPYPVEFAHNREFARGLSSTLEVGVGELAGEADGVLVCLGDMPLVKAADIRALVDRFEKEGGASICVPAWRGQRGHPVLWPSRYFPALGALAGDRGGRDLLEEFASEISWLEASDEGVLIDVDTPGVLASLQQASARDDPGPGPLD